MHAAAVFALLIYAACNYCTSLERLGYVRIGVFMGELLYAATLSDNQVMSNAL